MTTKFAIEAKRGEVYSFDPSQLVFSNFTGRKFGAKDEDVDKMVKSLLLPAGQLQNIGVRKGFDGEVIVIFGHTRVKAAIKINEQKLTPEPFIIRGAYFKVSEEEAALMTLLENSDDTRTAVSAIDTAHFMRELSTRFGYTNVQIGEKLGKQASQVTQYFKLLELPTPIQQQISDGVLNFSAALTLTKIAPESRDEVLETVVATGKKVTASAVANTAKAKKVKIKGDIRPTMRDLKVLMEDGAANDDRDAVNSACLAFVDYLNGTLDGEALLDALALEE